MIINRRKLLALSGISLLAPILPSYKAFGKSFQDRKLIFITLRGGMDGLAAFPLLGDKNLVKHRPDIWANGYFETNEGFGIHPKLKAFSKMWSKGEASIVHAVGASGYSGRSHFDGQNILQTGHNIPYAEHTGWLGRALALTDATFQGTAMDLPLPLVLRGAGNLESKSPSYFPPPDPNLLFELQLLNMEDPAISKIYSRLVKRRLDTEARNREVEMAGGGDQWSEGINVRDLADMAGRELYTKDEVKIAVFDYHGFDTHARQGATNGEHARQLKKLDIILSTLKDRLQEKWKNTLVVAATEFGRNVFQNGSNGTDHGFGSAILLAGGLVSKSQVYSDWPGLKENQLFQGKDLNVTIDQNTIFAGALKTVLGLEHDKILEKVFFNNPYPDLSSELFRV